MKKIAIGIAALLPSVAHAKWNEADVARLVNSQIDAKKMVGCVVATLEPDGTHVLGYGETARGSSKKPDGDTIFEIGSVTKTFTATLAALLIQDHVVDLRAPISKFFSIPLPHFGTREITLRDLLTQTSGLPRLPNDFVPKDLKNPYVDYTEAKLNDFLSHYSLTRSPGAEFEYSNLGFSVLGALLEHATKQSFESLVVERIAKPLSMHSTHIARSGEKDRAAQGYDDESHATPPWDQLIGAAAGAVRSTTNDLIHFVRAEIDPPPTALGRAISDTQRWRHDTQNGNGIGLAWQLRKDGVIWHNGGTGGFRSYVGFDPDRKVGVIVLANQSNADVDDLGASVIKILHGDPVVKTVVVPANKLDSFVGEYEISPQRSLTIQCENDSLTIQLTGQSALHLKALPASETKFRIAEVDAEVEFSELANGRFRRLALNQRVSMVGVRR